MTGRLWKTKFLPLETSIDDDGEALTCIDDARALHDDGKGHSGLFVTMCLGVIINVLKKLGLVATILTETEIVASGERFPKCIWSRYFRLA